MLFSIRVASGLALLGSVIFLVGTGVTGYITGEDPLENMLESFHQSSERDFVDLEGFGVNRTYNIQGFTPDPARIEQNNLNTIHNNGLQVFRRRTPSKSGNKAEPLVIDHLFRDKLSRTSHVFDVVDAELVSLLMHDEPCVYDIDSLSVDNLENVPTRPLDAFEQSALEQVQNGDRIVFEEQAGDIRMLGELRAIKQCQECHSVEQGTLLGAFSYRLRRKQ